MNNACRTFLSYFGTIVEIIIVKVIPSVYHLRFVIHSAIFFQFNAFFNILYSFAADTLASQFRKNYTQYCTIIASIGPMITFIMLCVEKKHYILYSLPLYHLLQNIWKEWLFVLLKCQDYQVSCIHLSYCIISFTIIFSSYSSHKMSYYQTLGAKKRIAIPRRVF